MKRSSAVLRIAECLIEPHYPNDAILEASFILKKLERMGMLPPIEPDRRVEDLDLGVPRWEPENDGD